MAGGRRGLRGSLGVPTSALGREFLPSARVGEIYDESFATCSVGGRGSPGIDGSGDCGQDG